MNENVPDLQPLRILCADDNVHVAALLRETLRAQGYCVESAVDGAHALTCLTEQPGAFDLLIADFRMPRLNGYDLAKHARAAGYTGDIIIFAGPLAPEDARRLRELPVHDIFEKPASQKQLLACVRKIAEARGARLSRDRDAREDRQPDLTERSATD